MTTSLIANRDEVVLEAVCCDLCGADAPEPLRELRDLMFETTSQSFQLVRCRRCGLQYLNPRPPVGQLDRYYRDDYAPFARHGLAARVKSLTFRREVAALWPLLAPPRRVVDLGCATGELLQSVREHGNENVLGIEPSATAADSARQRWGLDVITGTLESAQLPTASVNTALLAHTIEHLPSPSQTLTELQRVVKGGCSVVFWLPNADSWAAHLLGAYWIGYDAPRHLYDFTPATLARMLRECGFAMQSIHHEWIGLEWSWALRLRLRQQLPDSRVNGVLAALHPALTAAFTPVAALAALARRGGRIRVVATRLP
jgi:2-polyprenyl-3-methyl-5-hydroxy-6-metoxy-1,4-benzoquinol methylase